MAPSMTFKLIRQSLTQRLRSFGENESGATAIEYSLIVSLIFLAIIASVRAFTTSTSEMYGTIDEAMQTD